MVVCKYFMEGVCKFGSRCRFDHIQTGNDFRYADNYNNYAADRYGGGLPRKSPKCCLQQDIYNAQGQGRSVLRSSYVKYNNNTQAPVREETGRQFGKENVNEIYQAVVKEITGAERGNQWPLSCFGPVKGCLELNMPGWNDYSTEEIRWEFYKAYQNGTLDVCKQAIDSLYNYAKERRAKIKIRETGYSIIESLLEKENMNAVEMEQNVNSAPNVNWNHRGMATAAFSSNTVAPFANNNNNSNNTSFFGTASNNAFPAVGHPVSAFGIPQQTSPFGVVNPPVNESFRFNFSPTTNPESQTSVFPQNQFNMQDKVVNTIPAANNSARSDLQETTVFSKPSELSESDIKAFESNIFTFGNIPLKPPTKELCRI